MLVSWLAWPAFVSVAVRKVRLCASSPCLSTHKDFRDLRLHLLILTYAYEMFCIFERFDRTSV